MIKAILFDLDGVLIDMPSGHYKALNMALKEICGYEINLNEHEKYYNGISTEKKLNILENRGIIKSEEKQKIWNLKQQYTEKIIETFPEDKIKIEMFKKFKDEGYKLACVSNSIINSTKKMLEVIGVINYLDFYLGNENFGKNIKPNPYPYLLAFERFNLKPKQCLICEDSEKGLLSAYSSYGYVFEVKNINEVNYDNIKSFLNNI